MQHQIIFLNGPRQAGKDTAAKYIMQQYVMDAREAKFARALKLAAAALFNINQGQFRLFEDIASEMKLMKLPALHGQSWVEILIWLSEECMKPKFGDDILGRILLSHLREPTMSKLTVVSDCGFSDEIYPIAEFFGVKNCHLFRIYRPGCSFDGDSRKYVFEDHLPDGLHVEDIHNTFDAHMFRVQVLRRVDKIMGRVMEYN